MISRSEWHEKTKALEHEIEHGNRFKQTDPNILNKEFLGYIAIHYQNQLTELLDAIQDTDLIKFYYQVCSIWDEGTKKINAEAIENRLEPLIQLGLLCRHAKNIMIETYSWESLPVKVAQLFCFINTIKKETEVLSPILLKAQNATIDLIKNYFRKKLTSNTNPTTIFSKMNVYTINPDTNPKGLSLKDLLTLYPILKIRKDIQKLELVDSKIRKRLDFVTNKIDKVKHFLTGVWTRLPIAIYITSEDISDAEVYFQFNLINQPKSHLDPLYNQVNNIYQKGCDILKEKTKDNHPYYRFETLVQWGVLCLYTHRVISYSGAKWSENKLQMVVRRVGEFTDFMNKTLPNSWHEPPFLNLSHLYNELQQITLKLLDTIFIKEPLQPANVARLEEKQSSPTYLTQFSAVARKPAPSADKVSTVQIHRTQSVLGRGS